MKVSEAIEKLYAILPFLTDKFSQKVSITNITFSGTTATVTTETSHGLGVNDTCTVLDLYAPLDIISINRTSNQLTVITSGNHDITSGFQESVALNGSNEPEFNGTFSIISVDSNTQLTLSTVDSGATVATGSPILEQTTGSSYNGVIGYKTVVSVPDLNSFTYTTQSALSGSISSLGNVAVGFRITGAVSFESALDMYTANSDNEYWAFVVSGSAVASKDRGNNSDAIYVYNTNTGFRQELSQSFSVFVFATASDEIDAYLIKDTMQDVGVSLVKSLVGSKIDDGFTVGDYYATVYDTHLTQFYNKGIYTHNFIFQTTTQINDSDIFTPSNDVAFNSANIEMNVIVEDLQLKPDTQSMTVTANMRD